jgi:hypothetical protein
MKYVKILGLAVGAVAAFMAFVGAGSASATVLCRTNTSPCGSKVAAGTELKANMVSGTEGSLRTGFGEMKCKESAVKGTIEKAGSATEEVSGPISSLTFATCTGKVTVKKAGSLSVAFTSGSNGTLFSTGAEVEIEQIDVACTYGSPAKTQIAPVTGGTHATFVAVAEISKISGGFLCASPARWEAHYEVSTPAPLFVKAS